MKSSKSALCAATLAMSACVACSGTEPSDDGPGEATPSREHSDSPQVPVASGPYLASSFESNAAEELTLLRSLEALLQPMKDAEVRLATKPKASELHALFSQGAPSLESITTVTYRAQIRTWFAVFEQAAGNTWSPWSAPAQFGGLYGKWLFDPRGVDIRQAVEKGLYAAALYAHASNLAKGPLALTTTDRMLAIFGAHPSFPNNDKDPSHPDRFVAQYAERRDDESKAEPGLYRSIQSHLVRAQAAIQAADPSGAERAFDAFLKDWEKTIFSTVIYYAYDAEKKLSVDPPTDADLAAGLHSIGEIIGFLSGWMGAPTEHRLITNAQIDELLTMMLAPPGKDAQAYEFVANSSRRLGNLRSVIDLIKNIYGFSDDDIVHFRTNY